MKDFTGGRHKGEIGNLSQPLTMAVEKIRFHQRRQPLQRELIGEGRRPFDKHLLIRESPALIQTPHIPAVAQG